MKLLIIFVLILSSSLGLAAYKTSFSIGDVISASQINDNFKALRPTVCLSTDVLVADICVEKIDRNNQLFIDATVECSQESRTLCPAFVFARLDQIDHPDFAFTDGGATVGRWISDTCLSNNQNYHSSGGVCSIDGANIAKATTMTASLKFRCCMKIFPE